MRKGEAVVSFLVVLLQAAPHLSSLHPHHGVVSGGVSGRTVEYLGSDRPLFQLLGVPLDGMLDYELKELPAANGIFE